MPPFIPSNFKDIHFKFDTGGYVPPNFNSINFKFAPNLAWASLKNVITGIPHSVQPNDYLKGCDTNIVGYSDGNAQVFKGNCVYGGIRDLQLTIRTTNFRNLSAYIKTTQVVYSDLSNNVRVWDRQEIDDISLVIKGRVEQSTDLFVYLKQGLKAQKDLIEHLKVFKSQQMYLNEIIKGRDTSVPKDLFNTIRVYRFGDSDISEYVKVTSKTSVDLGTVVYKIWQHNNRNINLMLHSWQVADLYYSIHSWHIENLNIAIRAIYFNNIGAFLYAIQPVDIKGDIIGWDIRDLFISISEGRYGGDLPINIYGINSTNLHIGIIGKIGINVIKDLRCFTTNLVEEDLPAYLNTIEYYDLKAYLLSSRLTSDLGVEIFPKIVFVRHNINISFLEHRDLAAAINYTCVSSTFRELRCNLLVKYKLDLPCYVFGSDGSNVIDLKVLINSYDYISQNMLEVLYVNLNPNTKLNVNYTKSAIYHIDTIDIYSSTINKGYSNFSYNIIGDMLYENLLVKIHPYSNRHYGTRVKQKFVTLKLKDNIEDFRKYVEITFNSYASKYYYFSGNQKAYKAFHNDHWVVKVEGHKILPVGRGYEKTQVSRKYIFNLRHYDSIDAAITDMIDRVTQLKYLDLGVGITPIAGPHKDLNACVMPTDLNGIVSRVRYYTNRVLLGSILVTRPQKEDLISSITSMYPKGESNLEINITAKEYVGSNTGAVNFNFEGSGDILPEPDQIDFTFILEDD